eukprot:scaffold21870_cov60-Phaeocystis_antarctica.AAC.2
MQKALLYHAPASLRARTVPGPHVYLQAHPFLVIDHVGVHPIVDGRCDQHGELVLAHELSRAEDLEGVRVARAPARNAAVQLLRRGAHRVELPLALTGDAAYDGLVVEDLRREWQRLRAQELELLPQLRFGCHTPCKQRRRCKRDGLTRLARGHRLARGGVRLTRVSANPRRAMGAVVVVVVADATNQLLAVKPDGAVAARYGRREEGVNSRGGQR